MATTEASKYPVMVGLRASGWTPMLRATCGNDVFNIELSSNSRKKTPATVRTAGRELLERAAPGAEEDDIGHYFTVRAWRKLKR